MNPWILAILIILSPIWIPIGIFAILSILCIVFYILIIVFVLIIELFEALRK